MRNSSGMKGGFLSPEKYDPQSSQIQNGRSTNEKDKKINMTTITPSSIKYVMDCLKNSSDDTLIMDGVNLDHFSICGRVLKISEDLSRIIIKIDDGTGSLNFYIYLKSKNELPLYYQKANIKENSYIKAILNITNFQDTKIFLCSYFNEVTNFNEVSAHILTTIQTHLHRTRGYLKSHDEGNKENALNSEKKTTNKKSENFAGVGNIAKFKEILDKANNLSEKVYEICKALSENHEKPITLEEVIRITKSKYEENAISNELKLLVQNGFLYTSGNGYKVLD